MLYPTKTNFVVFTPSFQSFSPSDIAIRFYLQRTVSIRRATIRAGTAKRILEKIVPGGRSSAGFADLGRRVLRSLLAAIGSTLSRQICASRGER